MKKIAFYLIDLIAVLSFVIIGRSAHGHTDSLLGIWRTSWPFLVGAILGWLLLAVRKHSISSVFAGITVTITVVIVGMVIRVVVGQGTALGFIGVSIAYFTLTSTLARIVYFFYSRKLRPHLT